MGIARDFLCISRACLHGDHSVSNVRPLLSSALPALRSPQLQLHFFVVDPQLPRSAWLFPYTFAFPSSVREAHPLFFPTSQYDGQRSRHERVRTREPDVGLCLSAVIMRYCRCDSTKETKCFLRLVRK